MKSMIMMFFLSMGILSVTAQEAFTIEGKVKGLKDGAIISLFRMDGNSGRSIAHDTVRNETFRFKEKTLDQGTEKLSISGRGEGFPSMGLDVWVAPGAQVRITGDNNYLYTWKVESPLKQQKDREALVESARTLWDEFQRLGTESYALIMKIYAGKLEQEERTKLKTQVDSLRKMEDELHVKIAAREIAHLQQTPVSEVWLDKLCSLSLQAHYQKDFPYKDDVLALFQRMNEEEKKTEVGKTIQTYLFPPVVVQEGEAMADADLFDLEGKVHHLADYKGKYILVDIWSAGCGPCIQSLPELKEISEQYADKLTVVGLSCDRKKTWERASAEHNITWLNVNDLQGTNGLYAKYGVRGIPSYVLISPEGIVMKKWSGYGKGSLKQKLRCLDESM